MYDRDIETNKEQHEQHISNLKAAAAKRLAEVAAKMKLKRKGEPKGKR